MKHYLGRSGLLIVFLLFVLPSFAQQDTLTGVVKDVTGFPIAFARVSLFTLPDSAFVDGTVCDEKGIFNLSVKDSGQYQLFISFTGFEKKSVPVLYQNRSLDLGSIVLNADAKILETVHVETEAVSTSQNGDTTNYNANAFKVNPDANAGDLVTKIPGVGVVDGKIEAQGEQVTEVLVDGKPFFGSDPNAVLKNIPAEMIDQVQIYDKKSDQSDASGIDDGTTTKTINIITKVDYKNGTFGRFYGGYGDQNKYSGGFSINHFKDNQRISFIGLANNINQQNFSGDDLSGIFNSGGKSSNEFSGYMNTSNFYVSQKNGVSATYSTGINYVNEWKKTKLTGSYFFNLSSNETRSDLNRTYLSDDIFENIYTESSTSLSDSYSHRFNIKFDFKIDSSNSINIKPVAALQQHVGESSLTGQNYSGVFLNNDISTVFNSEFSSVFISLPVTFTHKFAKKKRSFSVYLAAQYDLNNGSNGLVSQSYTELILTDSLDQISNLHQNGYYFNSEISYSEPIHKNAQIVFSVENEYSKSFADRRTFVEDLSGDYNTPDTNLSNEYNLNYFATRPVIAFKYQWPKSSISFNAAGQLSELFGSQEFPFSDQIDKSFYAFLPAVQFTFRPEKKKNLRINYSTKTENPTLSEMQSVIDNSNPIQLKSGNSNLIQEYFQTLSVRYSFSNTNNNSNFQFSLSGSHGKNYIGSNSIIAYQDTLLNNGIYLSEGMQYRYPVNMNGYFNARAFVMYARQIKMLKSNGSVNLGINYSNRPSMINDQANKTASTSFRLTLGLSSNISEKIDFNINSNGSYTIQNNTIRPESNNSYYNQKSQIKLIYTFWKGFVLEADGTHQYYNGLNKELTNNFITANASFGYKFFKKKSGHLRLTVFDIFNQNSAVTRTINDIYFEDFESNTINRYFLIEFIYKFNHFKAE
jgi:hypothetical protein